MRAYSYHESLGGPLHVMRYRDVDPRSLAEATSFYALMTLVELEQEQQVALIRGPQRALLDSADIKWGQKADGKIVMYGVIVPSVEVGMMMLHMGFSI